MSEDNFAKVESNWNAYSKLLGKFKDEGIDKLLESLGERLCVAPSNPRVEQYGCYPGGLLDSSLKIATTMKKLKGFHDSDISVGSVLKVGLLHDIGRIGDMENEWLTEQDSDWHHERGFHFKQNYDLVERTHLQRTMFFLQNFGIKLNQLEYDALISLDDQVSRNVLASLLLHARNILINKS